MRRLFLFVCAFAFAVPVAGAEAPISFEKQVRPILQANCQGCHQPAKANADYIMTDFKRLLTAGESGKLPIVAGKPDESELFAQIKLVNGKSLMPKNAKPLHETDIDLIRNWITQGAKDDSPTTRGPIVDAAHPPTYSIPAVIPALDYSPKGDLLAVAGFHETFLLRADEDRPFARLVGLSERVQSVKFSPNGELLAVAGGNPGRFGEVQIWNVAKAKLILSIPVGFDTLYGVSWSDDGKIVAVGCSDNAVRAFDAGTGVQTLQQAAHSDWVLGTAFSKDASHLVSVGRDMTVKLTEYATQRFVDNVTSITPGALKGGIQAVVRHPKKDEIIVGGSDGTPKVYRLYRETARKIGDDSNLLRKHPVMPGRIFALAMSADGSRFVAGSGLDRVGQVAIFRDEQLDAKSQARIKAIESKVEKARTAAEKAELAKLRQGVGKDVVTIEIPDASIYAVAFRADGAVVAAAGSDGKVRIYESDSGKLVRSFVPAPITSVAVAGNTQANFIRDVSPILARSGCNQGTCHGAAQGKNGFKLSLRGYDPLTDVRAFTDELASRRVNIAAPDDSLMLLKATNAVPHVGGQLFKPSDPYYAVVRSWIAGGAKLDVNTPKVKSIALTPVNPVVEKAGATQAFQVIAMYADGSTRDVTKEAFTESGNSEVAEAAPRGGVLTAIRRGEAPILVRYEGAYAATTLTVMGDRDGFTWKDPPTYNKIDEFTAAKWKRLKIEPSGLCTDDEFLRRVYLDLTGLPPTADEVRAFLADTQESRQKREAVVDRLIGSKAYVEYWTNKWADLLQVNRKFLGQPGAVAFRGWIRNHVEKNTPYDKFAAEILTASGSNKDNPAASYFKILRDPTNTMENTTHLFLAVRFNCNKCHDHPFERWTQDQYYQLSAYFARTGLKADPASGTQKVGGTAVEGAKALYEIVENLSAGEVKHERTGAVVAPQTPYPAKTTLDSNASRREQLSAWVTSADNAFFAKSYVNRMWGYLNGVGIIEPIDDIRAGNPPTNPELLEYLTQEFLKSGWNSRAIHRLICTSRTYQLSVESNRWNKDDKRNFSHATPKRLLAETLYDTVYQVVGATSNIPGVAAGTRAAELPDSGVELPTGFLAAFGRPVRESACECERSSGLQLGPVMALVNGQTIADAISDPKNAIAELTKKTPDNDQLIRELYLRIWNRPPTSAEIAACRKAFDAPQLEEASLRTAIAKREAEVSAGKDMLEKERLATVARLEAEIKALDGSTADARKKAEAERLERIAKAEKDVKASGMKIDERIAAIEKTPPAESKWTVLTPKTVTGPKGVKYAVQADGSVLAEGAAGVGVTTFTAEMNLTKVTGIRLEALSDAKLPSGGPGRAENGNFVLNQFAVSAVSKKNATDSGNVALTTPKATFSQATFNPSNLIDGTPAPNKGWAVSPSAGVSHHVFINAREPFGYEGGTLVTITLTQTYVGAPKHQLGKFRIAVTTDAKLELGLPTDIKAVLAIAEKERQPAQRELLTKYFTLTDTAIAAARMELAEAKKPLPENPKLTDLKMALEAAKKPLGEDRKLAQLKADLQFGITQSANARLTAAQDIAWALINSPAFLFNR